MNPAPVIRGSLFLISYMTDRKPYSLGKSERLKSRKQIDTLFELRQKNYTISISGFIPYRTRTW